MGYDNYLISGYDTPSVGMGAAGAIWLIIALVLSLVGCFVVYFLFVVKADKPKEKFLAWLKSFLSFDKMLIEPMLKIGYLFAALFTTLGSFAFIGSSFLAFLFTLVLGNLIVRLVYEAALMKVMIWKNTTEIKNKLK